MTCKTFEGYVDPNEERFLLIIMRQEVVSRFNDQEQTPTQPWFQKKQRVGAIRWLCQKEKMNLPTNKMYETVKHDSYLILNPSHIRETPYRTEYSEDIRNYYQEEIEKEMKRLKAIFNRAEARLEAKAARARLEARAAQARLEGARARLEANKLKPNRKHRKYKELDTIDRLVNEIGGPEKTKDKLDRSEKVTAFEEKINSGPEPKKAKEVRHEKKKAAIKSLTVKAKGRLSKHRYPKPPPKFYRNEIDAAIKSLAAKAKRLSKHSYPKHPQKFYRDKIEAAIKSLAAKAKERLSKQNYPEIKKNQMTTLEEQKVHQKQETFQYEVALDALYSETPQQVNEFMIIIGKQGQEPKTKEVRHERKEMLKCHGRVNETPDQVVIASKKTKEKQQEQIDTPLVKKFNAGKYYKHQASRGRPPRPPKDKPSQRLSSTQAITAAAMANTGNVARYLQWIQIGGYSTLKSWKCPYNQFPSSTKCLRLWQNGGDMMG